MEKKDESQIKGTEKQEQSDLDSEISSEINFLQEKIKERPVNKKKLFRRTVITVVMAMVFGLVACITFLLLEPVINKMIYPEEEAEIVRFPEEEEEVAPEDMVADEEELQIIQDEEAAEGQQSNAAGNGEGENAVNQQGEASGQENKDGMGQNTVPGQMPDEEENENSEENGDGNGEMPGEEISPEEAAKIAVLGNYQKLYDVLGELRSEVEKSMVTVTTVTSDVNWINDILENTGTTSGLIIADNGKELLILADYVALKNTDNILITFWDSRQGNAEVKEVDAVTGLAVLAMPLTELEEGQREEITCAALGSSLGKTLIGQPVMAVGTPIGIGGSASYGMVTSQGTALGLRDSNYKLITTDIYGSSSASGVLVNMQGQVVGILYNGYESEDMQNQLCAIGISELKKTIEKLSNGEQMVYLGVHGAEINLSIYDKYQLPKGAYVTKIDMSSPAMAAGVQSGDIITKVNDTNIVSQSDFVNVLMNAHIGDELTLNIARQGQGEGEYQEMTIEVTLREQPET